MTNQQKAALSAARQAVLDLQGELPPIVVSGSIREFGGGFDIRLCTNAGVFVVRTALDGTVETIAEEKVH